MNEQTRTEHGSLRSPQKHGAGATPFTGASVVRQSTWFMSSGFPAGSAERVNSASEGFGQASRQRRSTISPYAVFHRLQHKQAGRCGHILLPVQNSQLQNTTTVKELPHTEHVNNEGLSHTEP